MNFESKPKKERDWSNYYEKTRALEVPSLVLDAIFYTKDKSNVIDIGAGSLRDTRFLLSKGFNVTALDSSPLLTKEAEGLDYSKIKICNESFEDFNFPENQYDLAVSILSLSFLSPQEFYIVFDKIKKSLKTGGILCITLWGEKSSRTISTDGTYNTRDDIDRIFSDMEILQIKETEGEAKTVMGLDFYKHEYGIIAKKI